MKVGWRLTAIHLILVMAASSPGALVAQEPDSLAAAGPAADTQESGKKFEQHKARGLNADDQAFQRNDQGVAEKQHDDRADA